MLSDSNAGFAEILWNVGTPCSDRTFCINSMGISVRNLRFFTYTCRDRLVKAMISIVTQNDPEIYLFFS
jgi:hypothetical protein